MSGSITLIFSDAYSIAARTIKLLLNDLSLNISHIERLALLVAISANTEHLQH